ncbi:hypothetical protein [Streptomyces mirabilis]|uniref:hypothetical protein n=1 Tax=Streptomyces mirabilis TaxID=68239 RepID=UPI0032545CD6
MRLAETTWALGTRREPTPAPSAKPPPRRAHVEDEAPQLLTPEDEEGFRLRWQEAQNRFLDDPRGSVHSADALVADVMQKLAATFADHKQERSGAAAEAQEGSAATA